MLCTLEAHRRLAAAHFRYVGALVLQGRLSKEDIERMLQEAEKFKAQDENIKAR